MEALGKGRERKGRCGGGFGFSGDAEGEDLIYYVGQSECCCR